MNILWKFRLLSAGIPLFPKVNPDEGLILSIPKIIAGLINLAIFVAGGLSVIFLIVGALRLVLSTGTPANIASAKKTITYAVAGLILSLLAVAIVAVINPGLVGQSGSGVLK